MPAGDIETYHLSGMWRNKIEGRKDELSEHETKAEALAQGHLYAVYLSGHAQHGRAVEHIVGNEDGTIADRNTYARSDD